MSKLTDEQKSELCLECGKCCMIMGIFGGVVDSDFEDVKKWANAHGVSIQTERVKGRTLFHYVIPKRCNELVLGSNSNGETTYRCGIYETRPQMCRDYQGDAPLPYGVGDCKWRDEPLEEQPVLPVQFVQITKV